MPISILSGQNANFLTIEETATHNMTATCTICSCFLFEDAACPFPATHKILFVKWRCTSKEGLLELVHFFHFMENLGAPDTKINAYIYKF